jgi:hypothetical protein
LDATSRFRHRSRSAARIAAGRFALVDHGAACLPQPGIDLVQLGLVLGLNPQMIESRLATACRDRKIDTAGGELNKAE